MRDLWNKFITALRNWPWVGRKEAPEPTWQIDPFFTEEQRRTERLALLARYIQSATFIVAKRKAQKKKHSDVLAAIKLAQNERLMIETGRMVYDPAFGAWVVKAEGLAVVWMTRPSRQWGHGPSRVICDTGQMKEYEAQGYSVDPDSPHLQNPGCPSAASAEQRGGFPSASGVRAGVDPQPLQKRGDE